MRGLVIGGSGAVGASIASKLASRGLLVGIGYSTGRDRAERLAKEIAGSAIHIDVREPARMEQAIEEFAGDEPLTTMVYAAGVSRDGLLLGIEEKDWSEVMEVNLTGAQRALRVCGKGMMLARHGVMVFISSVTAIRPSRGQNAYAVSKAGLECLVRLAALELAPYGVRVNAVSAGGVAGGLLRNSPQAAAGLEQAVPMKRLADPEEVAVAAAWLVSPEASYVTGCCLTVDGGWSLGAPGAAAALRESR